MTESVQCYGYFLRQFVDDNIMAEVEISLSTEKGKGFIVIVIGSNSERPEVRIPLALVPEITEKMAILSDLFDEMGEPS
jgi:hypothetical protein